MHRRLANQTRSPFAPPPQVLTLRQLKVRRFESLSGQRFSQLIIIAILTGAATGGARAAWRTCASMHASTCLAASATAGSPASCRPLGVGSILVQPLTRHHPPHTTTPPGLFWWQRGGGGRGGNLSLLAASDIVGLLFFELLFPSFQALFSALFLFPAGERSAATMLALACFVSGCVWVTSSMVKTNASKHTLPHTHTTTGT